MAPRLALEAMVRGARVTGSRRAPASNARVRASRPRQWDLVLVIALGGLIGAEARFGLDVAFPHRAGQFPWSTVLVNALGCFVIGALMVLLLELTSPHRLARPFLATGLLGGFTTFSTFAVDTWQLLDAGRAAQALGYLALSLAVCLVAVYLSSAVTQLIGARIIAARIRRRDEGSGACPPPAD